jgi:toxin HigB-1
MVIIESAADERDLRNLKGLRLEKLKGDRAGQSSMRLNKQFRLVVTFEREDEGNVLVVVGIEDYH